MIGPESRIWQHTIGLVPILSFCFWLKHLDFHLINGHVLDSAFDAGVPLNFGAALVPLRGILNMGVVMVAV
jgi:hypothetical protein